jgi:CheY-like chemotaxis protein
MGTTILVVDDDPSIVDLTAAVLADEGYVVVSARDGIEALAAIERERPDLLLTDNMMPRLSGLDLIARLHARPDLAVPTILMSAVRPTPGPPPAVVFLPKPFDLDDLLALVVGLLDAPPPRDGGEAR